MEQTSDRSLTIGPASEFSDQAPTESIADAGIIYPSWQTMVQGTPVTLPDRFNPRDRLKQPKVARVAASVTRPELDAKLELIETRMDARVARIEGKIDAFIERVDGRTKAVDLMAESAARSAAQAANLKYHFWAVLITMLLGIGAISIALYQANLSAFQATAAAFQAGQAGAQPPSAPAQSTPKSAP